MTYQELHSQTTGWTARHITQDLLAMYGPDAEVSEQDAAQVEIANFADKNDMPFHVAAAIYRLQAKAFVRGVAL